MSRDRILNYGVLTLLLITTAMGYQSPWGLLFLYWIVPNFYSGHAFLVSDVTREDDPVLFWLIQVAWVMLGLLMIAADFFPQALSAA